MGVLVDGVYYPDKTLADVREPTAPVGRQAQQSRLEMMAQRHDRELTQPYLPSGAPNPDFIKHFPEAAKDYGFIKEEQHE